MKIDPMAVLILPKRFDGLDLVFRAHIIYKIAFNGSLFCTYLEIGDDLTGGIWSYGHA